MSCCWWTYQELLIAQISLYYLFAFHVLYIYVYPREFCVTNNNELLISWIILYHVCFTYCTIMRCIFHNYHNDLVPSCLVLATRNKCAATHHLPLHCFWNKPEVKSLPDATPYSCFWVKCSLAPRLSGTRLVKWDWFPDSPPPERKHTATCSRGMGLERRRRPWDHNGAWGRQTVHDWPENRPCNGRKFGHYQTNPSGHGRDAPCGGRYAHNHKRPGRTTWQCRAATRRNERGYEKRWQGRKGTGEVLRLLRVY